MKHTKFFEQYENQIPIYFIDKERNEIREGIIDSIQYFDKKEIELEVTPYIWFTTFVIYFIKSPVIISGVNLSNRIYQLLEDEIYATKNEAITALSRLCKYKKDSCLMLNQKNNKTCSENMVCCTYCSYYQKHKNMTDDEKNLTSKLKIDDEVYYREISSLIFKITKVKLTKKGYIYKCKNISKKGTITIEYVTEDCLEKV
jgi:hypothetical protein